MTISEKFATSVDRRNEDYHQYISQLEEEKVSDKEEVEKIISMTGAFTRAIRQGCTKERSLDPTHREHYLNANLSVEESKQRQVGPFDQPNFFGKKHSITALGNTVNISSSKPKGVGWQH